MPTYEGTARFWRDFHRLNPDRRRQFLAAVMKLVHDLKTDKIRARLRVKDFRGIPGVFEMSWAPDGRALFRYGDAKRPGDKHIIWQRVGTHEIFDEP